MRKNNKKQDLIKLINSRKLIYYEPINEQNKLEVFDEINQILKNELEDDYQLVIINTQEKEANMNTNNKEQGFNNTQIKQLVEIVRTIIREEVPPMIDQAINIALEPIKNRLYVIEKDVELIKQDIKQIKNCPTIKKELGI